LRYGDLTARFQHHTMLTEVKTNLSIEAISHTVMFARTGLSKRCRRSVPRVGEWVLSYTGEMRPHASTPEA